MKKLFKYVALVIASIFSLSAFVGCNAEEDDDDSQVLTVKSIKLYDRWGRQICIMTPEEMIEWSCLQDQVVDYWYEISYEETSKTCSGHFSMVK